VILNSYSETCSCCFAEGKNEQKKNKQAHESTDESPKKGTTASKQDLKKKEKGEGKGGTKEKGKPANREGGGERLSQKVRKKRPARKKGEQ